MIKKMLTLLFLAVRWCSSSAPLSLIQRQISTVYYFGTAAPPKVIPWYNSRINDNIQLLIINNRGTAAYAVREAVSCLSWHTDDAMQVRYYPVQGSMCDTSAVLRGISDSQKRLFSAVNPINRASCRACPVGYI